MSTLSCMSFESFLQFIKPSFKLILFCFWNFATSTLYLKWSPPAGSLLGMIWYFPNLSFYNPQLCLETFASVITQTYHTMLIKIIAEVGKINGKLIDDTKKRSQTGGWKTNPSEIKTLCSRPTHNLHTPIPAPAQSISTERVSQESDHPSWLYKCLLSSP